MTAHEEKVLYEELVVKHSDKFTRIEIPQTTLERINGFAPIIAARKSSEREYQIDDMQKIKRFTTGLKGEAAIEQLLGIPVIDWTIGNTEKYSHPDIPGYNVGVKTVERNKFPIIKKSNPYPQIVCITSDKQDDLVFVCGLATPQVLNYFQSKEFVRDDKLKAKDWKTGFYGFGHLVNVTSLADLEQWKLESARAIPA